ncbi:MAG: zinc ribbon domain-containing protein [Eubacteriaceae bacterium]|nr:zinc ribbon domain-containing protein [Eubacteriaceae bacterium]
MPKFIGSLSRRVEQTKDNAVNKGKIFAESAKLSQSIRDAEKSLKEAKVSFADFYLEKYKTNPTDDFAEYIEAIIGIQNTITELSQKREALRETQACAHCGAKIPAMGKFCPECGKTATFGRSSETSLICPKCGRSTNPELAYCTFCEQDLASVDSIDKEIKKIEEMPADNLRLCKACYQLLSDESEICPNCSTDNALK